MMSLHALALGALLVSVAPAASGNPPAVSFVTSEATGAITNLAIAGDATGMNWTHVADGSQYAWIGLSYGWGTGTRPPVQRPGLGACLLFGDEPRIALLTFDLP